MMKLFGNEEIAAIAKSDTLVWHPLLLQLMAVEVVVAIVAIAIALLVQTRKRDIV
jgi:hypothetical protein